MSAVSLPAMAMFHAAEFHLASGTRFEFQGAFAGSREFVTRDEALMTSRPRWRHGRAGVELGLDEVHADRAKRFAIRRNRYLSHRLTGAARSDEWEDRRIQQQVAALAS